MASLDLDQAIVELVSKQKVKVPPYPAVAFRIEAVVRGGNYGLDDLAKLVSSDQVLAADVLRCANSALYARGAPVASVKQAVGRIGAKDVARLALASGLGAHALAAGRLSSVRRKVWLDALASALLAQDLARARKLAPDVAFAAGLLHDFGKVVVIACIEELLQNRNDVAPKLEDEWLSVMDRYHVELGMVMAARWDLPPVIADAISLHHAPEVTAASEPMIVKTVATVDRVLALLAMHTRLGAEELATVPELGMHEREVMVRTIESLPGFIAAFENSDVWKGDARSGLVAAPPPPPAGPKPKAYPVVLKLGEREHSFQLLGIGATHCMIAGTSAVPENLLMEFKVACDPPLKGYASVKLAWPEQGGWTLLVQPFGLTEGAQSRWKQLGAEAEAA
ncbi:MAG TPA: HDOD domain-containing protein [Gemmatimonadaceae bacterium]|nr:HDOD domain-containing protein [Gemmatimonadaceae bacterium]